MDYNYNFEISLNLSCFLPFFLGHGHKTKSAVLEMKMRSTKKVEEKIGFKIRFYVRIQPSVKDFEQNMCSPAFLPYPTNYLTRGDNVTFTIVNCGNCKFGLYGAVVQSPSRSALIYRA